jgi:hypothetical protein
MAYGGGQTIMKKLLITVLVILIIAVTPIVCYNIGIETRINKAMKSCNETILDLYNDDAEAFDMIAYKLTGTDIRIGGTKAELHYHGRGQEQADISELPFLDESDRVFLYKIIDENSKKKFKSLLAERVGIREGIQLYFNYSDGDYRIWVSLCYISDIELSHSLKNNLRERYVWINDNWYINYFAPGIR